MTYELVHAELYAKTAAAGYPELRPAHFQLLRFPGPDGTRPTDLAARLDTSKQAISPLLNDLEGWGYLERHATTSDGRGRILHLTNRGRKLMRTIDRLHRQLEEDWAQHLGNQSLQVVLDALDHMTRDHPSHPQHAPEQQDRRSYDHAPGRRHR